MAYKSHRSLNRKHWFEWGFFNHFEGTLLSIELAPKLSFDKGGTWAGFIIGFSIFYCNIFFFEYDYFKPSLKKEVCASCDEKGWEDL